VAPSNDAGTYFHEMVALTTVDKGYATILVPLSILKADVPDPLTSGQSATAVPLTTEGMWYQPLAEFSTPVNAQAYGYMLTRYNYDAMASLLIPRAVAYSAGLIDYFFRGKIEVQDAGFTDAGLVLRVKNATDSKKTPAWQNETLTAGGKLVVAYQYDLPDPGAPSPASTHVGASQPVALTETLLPGKVSRAAYEFKLPVIPAEATNIAYRLVYRRKVGRKGDASAPAQANKLSQRPALSSRRIA